MHSRRSMELDGSQHLGHLDPVPEERAAAANLPEAFGSGF